MRRTHVRGQEKVQKRYFIHVAGYNLGLILRQLIGAGTPREFAARGAWLLWLLDPYLGLLVILILPTEPRQIPLRQRAVTPTLEEVKALLAADRDFLRPLVQAVLQELLQAEMTAVLGAEKGGRSAARLGYRAGYYDRTLITRVGKLELRVPQDRHGRVLTEQIER